MKLRLHRNSVRYRLSPADVTRLDSGGSISETTAFGPELEFSYSLRVRADIEAMRAVLNNHSLSVEIPAALVHDWSNTRAVGLHDIQSFSNGKTLEILIEKDFECRDEGMNDPREALYPNPGKACPSRPATGRR
jgi:hypothetical protein